MTQEELLSALLETENQAGVNDLFIEGIPVWPILKYRLRGYHNQALGIADITTHTKKYKKTLRQKIKWTIRSFADILRLLKKGIYNPVCFVGFTRLEKIRGVMIDKFIDPVISECGFNGNSCIYINNEEQHPTNRNTEHPIVYTDFIQSLSYLVTVILFPIIYVRNLNTFHTLTKFVRTYYTYNRKALMYLHIKPVVTYVQHLIYKRIFKRTCVRSVIGVARPSFLPQALAAKRLGIKVIELQHGVTHGHTNLYSGIYNEKIDPDYFCTFGQSCQKDVFNIPPSKIVNIGFALTPYLKKIALNEDCKTNCILVISEPQPSEQMLRVVLRLAEMYPNLQFHIRRHPQEMYSVTQRERIKLTTNVKDVSSNECSQLAIMPYKYVIGDNSSVLFEAMSIGKKVARLNCEGLVAYGYEEDKEDGFCYVNSLCEFELFINSNLEVCNTANVYSDFDSRLFKSLIS